jgi:hypothetical protein
MLFAQASVLELGTCANDSTSPATITLSTPGIVLQRPSAAMAALYQQEEDRIPLHLHPASLAFPPPPPLATPQATTRQSGGQLFPTELLLASAAPNCRCHGGCATPAAATACWRVRTCVCMQKQLAAMQQQPSFPGQAGYAGEKW